jgi:hypothetical protein
MRQEILKHPNRCPYCGQKETAEAKRAAEIMENKQWQLIAGILILIAIVVAVIIGFQQLKNKNSEPDPSSPITVGSE